MADGNTEAGPPKPLPSDYDESQAVVTERRDDRILRPVEFCAVTISTPQL